MFPNFEIGTKQLFLRLRYQEHQVNEVLWELNIISLEQFIPHVCI